MINTIFHFVNDPTFDYQTAVNNGDISEYTIVFNSADHSIHCKGAMFGRMSRADIAETLGNISDLIPVATDSTLGGIKIGYTNNADLNSRRYGVVLDDNNKAYVEVPWTDTITPEFDDTELKNLVATERERIDNFISNLSATIDAKNRELYADGDWVREIFGNAQDPGSVAAAYRKEIDDYLSLFDVWEYIDPEHPELGRKARIVELQNTADGLTHRMGEAETSISGNSVAISTLTHDLSGLTSTVTNISDNLDTVTRKESALEQTVDSIGLRVTASEGDISTLQTQEASLQIQADKIQSRVVATENSINGCYQVTIVDNPSNAASAVDVSTISAAVAARTSLSNNQLINDEDFTTAPTAETLYKNSVPQYFTFSRYQGLTVRASSLEQTADSITARVGTVEGSLNDPTTGLITRTSTLEQTALSLDARVGSVETQANTTDTALAALDLAVTGSGGLRESVSTLSTNLSNYETSNDNNLGKLVTMAASVLGLKTNQNGTDITTMSQLSNVITNEGFTGYSGLDARVSSTESSISALNDLMSHVVASSDPESADYGKPASGFKTEVTSGLATTAYADSAGASATAALVTSINNKTAGINVFATKDSNGQIDSGITLLADQITLSGQTNFKTAIGSYIKSDVLEAGTATIDAATINSATITGTLSGVDGTFSGTLSGASGSFTGDVYANAFRAGSTTGFNITVESDSINFNYGDEPKAWFSMKKYVESANGPVEDTSATNAGGFYLYLISPATGNLVTIDFANLTFKEITSSGRPTPHRKNLIKLTNGTRTGEVKAETYTVYYTDDDGNGNAAPIAYYSDPALTTALTNAVLTDVYMIDDPKDYYNNNYYIAILLDNGNYQAKETVIRYRGVSMNGTDITTSGGYVYTATYGSGSNTYNRYCTPNSTARNFTNADLANGGGAYKFSGGSSSGTYFLEYASSKNVSTRAMSFFKVNTSGTAMERLQVSAVS